MSFFYWRELLLYSSASTEEELESAAWIGGLAPAAREAGATTPLRGPPPQSPPLRKICSICYFFPVAPGGVFGLKNNQRLGPTRRFLIRLATCMLSTMLMVAKLRSPDLWQFTSKTAPYGCTLKLKSGLAAARKTCSYDCSKVHRAKTRIMYSFRSTLETYLT